MVNFVITCSAYAQAGPSNCTKRQGLPGAEGKKRKNRGQFFLTDRKVLFSSRFAMRPRYGKKSILYKPRWVYIAGMRPFEPVKTIFR